MVLNPTFYNIRTADHIYFIEANSCKLCLASDFYLDQKTLSLIINSDETVTYQLQIPGR